MSLWFGVLLAALACGCPSARSLPGEHHLVLHLEPRYAEESGHLPPSFDLVLTLREDGTGVAAYENRDYPSATAMAPLRWREESGRIVVDTLALGSGTSGPPQLVIERMTLSLGADRGGTGTAAGGAHWLLGDVISSARFDATFDVRPDTLGPAIHLLWGETSVPLPGRLRIAFSEPVPVAAISSLVVAAGGEPVVGSITPSWEVGGLALEAVFTPRDFLPFDAEVGIEAAGLADPAGNAPPEPAPKLRTPADPGSLTSNPGFERGLEGWLAGGVTEARRADARGAFAGIEPAEGARQAFVPSGGWLIGRLDVPADASTLELSVAFLSEIGEMDAGRSGEVEIHVPDSATLVYDAAAHAGPGAPCSGCGDYGTRHAQRRVTADLTPFRSRRVFLTVRADASGYLGMNEYAVLLDDVRVR